MLLSIAALSVINITFVYMLKKTCLPALWRVFPKPVSYSNARTTMWEIVNELVGMFGNMYSVPMDTKHNLTYEPMDRGWVKGCSS